MATTDKEAASGVKGGYRVYRFPEAARSVIDGRPPSETIRAFVGRLVDERLPALVAALARLGVEEPGPSRPLRLPVTPALLGRLSEAGRVTGLPASRLLLMVLTAPTHAEEQSEGVPQKARRSGGGKKGRGGRPKRGQAKPSASTGRTGRRTKTAGPTEGASVEPTPDVEVG